MRMRLQIYWGMNQSLEVKRKCIIICFSSPLAQEKVVEQKKDVEQKKTWPKVLTPIAKVDMATGLGQRRTSEEDPGEKRGL